MPSPSSVKEAFERLTESLKGMLVDFQIPAINVSPIVDIFPYSEELDRELSRTPIEEVQAEPETEEIEEEEDESENSGVVFSASGSDVDDEDEDEDSEVHDDFEDVE